MGQVPSGGACGVLRCRRRGLAHGRPACRKGRQGPHRQRDEHGAGGDRAEVVFVEDQADAAVKSSRGSGRAAREVLSVRLPACPFGPGGAHRISRSCGGSRRSSRDMRMRCPYSAGLQPGTFAPGPSPRPSVRSLPWRGEMCLWPTEAQVPARARGGQAERLGFRAATPSLTFFSASARLAARLAFASSFRILSAASSMAFSSVRTLSTVRRSRVAL